MLVFNCVCDCVLQELQHTLKTFSCSGSALRDDVFPNKNVAKMQEELSCEWGELDREILKIDPSVDCIWQTSSPTHPRPNAPFEVTRPQPKPDSYSEKNKHSISCLPRTNGVPSLKSKLLVDVQYYQPGCGEKALLFNQIKRALSDSSASYLFTLNCSKNKRRCYECSEISNCMHGIFPGYYVESGSYTGLHDAGHDVQSFLNSPSLIDGVPQTKYKCKIYCSKYPNMFVYEARQMMKYLHDNFSGKVYLHMQF